jgi:hypothetical protein
LRQFGLRPKDPFSFIIFDKNWAKVRSGTIELPFNKADLFYDRPLLAKDGSIWFPFWTKDSRKGDVTHQIWVWRPGQREPEQLVIHQEEGLINSLRLTQSNFDGLIYGGAVYVEDTPRNRVDIFEIYHENQRKSAAVLGSIFFKIAPDGKLIQKTVHPFEASNLAFFMTNLFVIGSDHFYRLRVVDVFPLSNGNTVIKVEKRFFHMISNSFIYPFHEEACGCADTRSGYIQKYGPIFSVEFNPTGDFVRETFIKKQAVGNGTGATFLESFFWANDQSSFWIYPALEVEVLNPPKDINGLNYCEFPIIKPGKPNPNDECIALTAINKDNSTKSSVLLSSNKIGLHLYLNTYTQLTPDTYVFVGRNYGKQFGLMKFQFQP